MNTFSSILAIGALLACAGSIVAAPVPDTVPVPAKHTEYVWHTVYHTKVVGITKTEWVDPPTTTTTTTTTTTMPTTTTTPTTTSTTTTDEETTTETTTSTTTTEMTTSTTESTTDYPTTTTTTTTTTIPTTTSTTTTSPATTSTSTTTTSSTTTEEETTTTYAPVPTPTPTIPDIQVEVVTPTPTPTPEPQTPTGGGWEGDATYYDPGMGSCGIQNGPGDMIAAISYQVMDPMNPGNPNKNPLCGKQIRCTRAGKNPTIITVVDRCPVCKAGDLDLSPAAYAALGGTVAEGRFRIQCNWV